MINELPHEDRAPVPDEPRDSQATDRVFVVATPQNLTHCTWTEGDALLEPIKGMWITL
jgi:hypothetical protein